MKWRYPMSASDKTRQDFDEIDQDGDGHITASELLRASVKDNPKISDDNIAAIVQMADSDGDNKISYEEYARFVR
jgi:Ca2+-binding EF-hand superfamily protein